ncbi:type III secretion system stator protein SctL [Paraburkholderia sediminicola]|uniref:type III secretion system stator protein SctL n=1 Tax=Paraburkholderia sediminicola TaxID=458836 RepID=UPI0038B908B0
MMIWLREPVIAGAGATLQLGVGTNDDIVPREALAQLVELDDGFIALQNQHAEILARARAEAAEIVATAAADAAALRLLTQREFDAAQERGFEAGRLEAAAQWYARTAELLAQRREIQMSMRNRIAGLVVSAVERIVVNEHPAAMFARAATAVERIVDGSSYLRVRVNPDQRDAAAEEFARAAAGWRENGRPVQITVTADRALDVGACVCETDIGSMDASLGVQIEAVRGAVNAALRRALAQDRKTTGAEPAAGDAQDAGDTPQDTDDAQAPHAAHAELASLERNLPDTLTRSDPPAADARVLELA